VRVEVVEGGLPAWILIRLVLLLALAVVAVIGFRRR
jgi:hypothetical protein